MKKTIFATLLLLNSFLTFSQTDKILLDYPKNLNEKDVLIKWTKLAIFQNQDLFLYVKNTNTDVIVSKTEISKLDLFIVQNLVESVEYEYWVQQSYVPITKPIKFKFFSKSSRATAVNVVERAYISNYYNYTIYNLTLCTGTNTTLYGKVFPDDNTGLTYQWLKNGSDIVGATNNTLVTTGVGTYTLKIYQSGILFNSSNSVVIDYASSLIINFVTKNEPMFQCTGKTTNLFSIYNTPTATYQWTKNGVNIAGATNKSFVASETGKYNVTTQDNGCSFDNSRTGNGLYFDDVLYPQTLRYDSLYCSGGAGVRLFSVNTNPVYLSLQWLKNGVDIPNATNFNYEATDEGIYSFRISQANCSSVSDGIKVTKITEFPKSIIVYNHSDVCLANSITIGFGSQSLNYQWYKDGNILSGQLNQKITVAQSGVYKCLISSNGLCPTMSNEVIVTNGTNLNPKIEFNHERKDCSYVYLQYKGHPFDGSVNLSNLSFQWMKEGVNIAGANGRELYVTVTGNYQLRVTNTLTNCIGVSNILTPEISPIPEMVFQRGYSGSTACKNTYLGLFLNKWFVSGQTTYQWKKNGVALPNENEAGIYIKDAGNYSIVFSSGSCVAESTPIPVRIDSLPSVTLSGNSNILLNQNAILPLTFAGGAEYAVTLNDNVTHFLNSTTNFIQKQPLVNTTYSISSFGNHCGVGTFSGSHVVNILSCPPINTINNTLSTIITLKASDKIVGQNLIQTGANVRYSAKKSVIMSPPFKTESGVVFQADTEGCDN